MENDPNPALRAELTAAFDAVNAQVIGLIDLAKSSVSPDTEDAINLQVSIHTRRRNLVTAVIKALDAVVMAMTALKDDGYPDFPPAEVPKEVFDEIQEQEREISVAAHIFEQQIAALALTANPVDFKPKP